MNIKDNLVSTAFDLFLKYGIKSVSMDDISRKLGISKKTIYSVINTKDELIDDVLSTHLRKDECDIKSILDESHDALDEMVRITRHILVFISSMTPSIIYDLKNITLWPGIKSKKSILVLSSRRSTTILSEARRKVCTGRILIR
jgi:AcrR family transcriptional regulator